MRLHPSKEVVEIDLSNAARTRKTIVLPEDLVAVEGAAIQMGIEDPILGIADRNGIKQVYLLDAYRLATGYLILKSMGGLGSETLPDLLHFTTELDGYSVLLRGEGWGKSPFRFAVPAGDREMNIPEARSRIEPLVDHYAALGVPGSLLDEVRGKIEDLIASEEEDRSEDENDEELDLV